MKRLCSGCDAESHAGAMTVHGFNHRTNEPYFTCRKCLMLAGAQANLVLAHKRLERELAA